MSNFITTTPGGSMDIHTPGSLNVNGAPIGGGGGGSAAHDLLAVDVNPTAVFALPGATWTDALAPPGPSTQLITSSTETNTWSSVSAAPGAVHVTLQSGTYQFHANVVVTGAAGDVVTSRLVDIAGPSSVGYGTLTVLGGGANVTGTSSLFAQVNITSTTTYQLQVWANNNTVGIGSATYDPFTMPITSISGISVSKVA